MYISSGAALAVTGLVSRAFGGGHNNDIHPWIPPSQLDSRSPCPGLNTLANHGYVNHNGRNITGADLAAPFKSVYNLSDEFIGFLLATPGVDFAALDLHDLDKHNFIEHDASLVHDDANGAEYAPSVANQTKVAEIVRDNPTMVNLESLAKVRKQREAALATPLDPSRVPGAIGEAALSLGIIGKVSAKTDWYESFVGHDKLPHDYTVPAEEVTTAELGANAAKIKEFMDQL